MIEDGWDLAITVSTQQDYKDVLWHIGEEERRETLELLGYCPVQLQCGVMYFGRSGAMLDLFDLWRAEWSRYEDQDQGAFLRAIWKMGDKIKIWILGRSYNGGELVSHLFGKAKEIVDA